MAAARQITRGSALLVGALAAAVGCGAARSPAPASEAVAKKAAVTPESGRVVTSNVTRADYAGSASCAPCHERETRAWSASPMHRMTRVSEGAEVHAPFDGTVFRFKGDSAELFARGGSRFMRVTAAQTAKEPASTHLYAITRIIGGRVREDFAGVEVTSESAPVPRSAHEELVMPVSFLIASRTFRVKGYSVMVESRPGLRAGGVWNQTCILCHNTNPYLTSIYGELLLPGATSAPSYQGEVVDRLLPPSRRARFEITDRAALDRALSSELVHIGGNAANATGAAMIDRALRTTRTQLEAKHLVEVGIGCESCHGGSAEHAQNPQARPSYEPRAPFLASRLPTQATGDASAQRVNRTCARCHQVLFSRYPYTWEGGHRDAMGGGSHITSGEGRDFLLGGCASVMACTTCHDPHAPAEDARAALEKLATPAGNATCTATCHATLASDVALRGHSHHDPTGQGGACIACHMPKKNMGLGYALTRYHRIGSPTDKARVEHDRPLECALCHADKSVESLVGTMETWWQKKYDRTALRGLYDDLGADALAASLDHGKPHEVVTAMMALADLGRTKAAPKIVPALNHRFPLVRYFARDALASLAKAPLPATIDLDGDGSPESEREVLRGAAAFLAAHPASR